MKDKTLSSIHPDLFTAKKFAYDPSGLISKMFVKEAESEQYGAFTFEMNNKRIKFRVAKITPTKIGQFVTLWKRTGEGPIQPHDIEDPVDLFVVSVRTPDHFGQFVFPKTLLCEKGIVSKKGEGGRRAMRVYPPWDIPNNCQAEKTQQWQLPYFFEINPGKDLNYPLIQNLFLSNQN